MRSDQSYGSLVDPLGNVNRSTVDSIFAEFDQDGSGQIDYGELQGLLIGLELNGPTGSPGTPAAGTSQLKATESVDYWMKVCTWPC